MSVTTSRRTKAIRTGAVLLALLGSGLAVSMTSYSAFSASTQNSGDSWGTGNLALTNDATKGAALFDAKNLQPGDGGTKYITVTSNGSLAGPVHFYAANMTAAAQDGLADWINLTVKEGKIDATTKAFTADTDGTIFDGTMTSLRNLNSYGTGKGKWDVAGTSGETKTYEITYSFSKSAPNTTQGKSITSDLVWEIQAGS